MFFPVSVKPRTRIGEIAEMEIKKRLSAFSNPMKPTFDLGIDLYCELLDAGGVPSFKYFLVQAKGTTEFQNKWRRYFKKNTIQYWLQQPYPVYLVVYDMSSEQCYWMSINEHKNDLLKKIQSPSKKVPITIDKSHMLVEKEFAKQINEDITSIGFSLNLSRGFPQFTGTGYVKKIPLLILSGPVIHNIGVNIRLSLLFLARHYFYFSNDKDQAYFLCKFLTEFDKQHYDHFVLMGQICSSLGKTDESKRNYETAIEICKLDKNWDKRKTTSDTSIKDIIAYIQKEITKL
ncbi:DUF4365 domain-containing protein [Candidatus Bathyarchaeota archaeon]|nr:DUF4365 domain-containing protein [Candidatus Bathyarchaeota archaeon]